MVLTETEEQGAVAGERRGKFPLAKLLGNTEGLMATEIGRDDYKLKYTSLAEAKNMSGLRLILGAHTIPGPWREACKSLF